MKIVLAEKVSPATLAVFQEEPNWQIVTPDQIKNGLAAELADADALIVRSAVQADAKLLESAQFLCSNFGERSPLSRRTALAHIE